MSVLKYTSAVCGLLATFVLTGCTGFEALLASESDSNVLKGSVLSYSNSVSSSQLNIKLAQRNQISSLSTSQLKGLKVKLFQMDNLGFPAGLPLAQTETDEYGAFSFKLSKDLSSRELEYIVNASSSNLSVVFESIVTSSNIEVSEASSVAVKAIRFGVRATGQFAQDISHENVSNMVKAATSIISQNVFSTVADAYSLVTNKSEFQDALSAGFNANLSSINQSLPPDVIDIIVSKNGMDTNNLNFKPGDVVSLRVLARDPNERPMQFKFTLSNHCTLKEVLQDWSSATTVSYTFETSDITDCTSILWV